MLKRELGIGNADLGRQMTPCSPESSLRALRAGRRRRRGKPPSPEGDLHLEVRVAIEKDTGEEQQRNRDRLKGVN